MKSNQRTLLSSAVLLSLLLSPLAKAATPITESRTSESAVTPVEKCRHSDFMREIKAGNGEFGFVLLGDSITDWWPKRNGPDTYAQFAPWKPLDLGVSGETTEEVLWRIMNGELDGYHAKVVMIMIGTNNLGHYGDERPEWVAAGIKKIIETVRAKQPQAKILLLAIFPRSATAQDAIRLKVDATNKLLPALADDKTVFFLDIGPKFLDPQGNLPKMLMPDLLHPNADGYRVWINAVKSKLEELMGSPLAPEALPSATPSAMTSPVASPSK